MAEMPRNLVIHPADPGNTALNIDALLAVVEDWLTGEAGKGPDATPAGLLFSVQMARQGARYLWEVHTEAEMPEADAA